MGLLAFEGAYRGQQKDLGTRLKPLLTGWSLRVTVSACGLDLLHACPSCLCGLLIQSWALGNYTKPGLLCQGDLGSGLKQFRRCFALAFGSRYKPDRSGRWVIIRDPYPVVKQFSSSVRAIPPELGAPPDLPFGATHQHIFDMNLLA
jgi:hypothetical protein